MIYMEMKIAYEDRYDSLIQYLCGNIFPEIDWRIVKAQIWQESRFDTKAISSASCMGLMQISRGLAKERLEQPAYVWCADVNLDLGITYLKEQYDHFPEIPEHANKILFSLASYNGGRGYINAAIRIANFEKQQFTEWRRVAPYLSDRRCLVRGKYPDAKQIRDYVDKIMMKYAVYTELT